MPLANTLVEKFDFTKLISHNNQRNVIFVCELWQNNSLISTSIATFAPSKHLNLADPKLMVTIKEEGTDFIITCTSNLLARFVELKLKGFDIVFSDNYFDIPAGRTKSVRCVKPDAVTLDKANHLLQTYSLFESY